MAWIVWLVVAAVLGVAELMTTTFALGIIAIGALVAAGVGAMSSSRRCSRPALPRWSGGPPECSKRLPSTVAGCASAARNGQRAHTTSR